MKQRTIERTQTAKRQKAIATQKVNFTEMVESFIRFVDVSQSSAKTYLAGVRAFLKYTAENGITQPTNTTIIEYKKVLSERLSASTTALYLSALRRLFQWLESTGAYKDITRGVKSPRVDKGHKRDAFTATQLKGIIGDINRDNLKGKRNYAIFALMSATGLRCVEVMRANIEDIRSMAGADVLFIQGKGKTSKADFVKLSAPVLKAIQDYISARGTVNADEPLFVSCSRRNTGKRLTTRSVSRAVKSAMLHAGYNSRRLTAHSLRHSAVTLALMAGNNIQDVCNFARHSNIAVTLIYSHDVERLKSRCENSISTAIFG